MKTYFSAGGEQQLHKNTLRKEANVLRPYRATAAKNLSSVTWCGEKVQYNSLAHAKKCHDRLAGGPLKQKIGTSRSRPAKGGTKKENIRPC